MPALMEAFQTIGLAKVSTSAYEAFDLGYLRDNNEVVTNLGLGYYIFEPIGKIIKAEAEFEAEHKMLYKPFEYKQLELESKFHVVWKNHFYFKAMDSTKDSCIVFSFLRNDLVDSADHHICGAEAFQLGNEV